MRYLAVIRRLACLGRGGLPFCFLLAAGSPPSVICNPVYLYVVCRVAKYPGAHRNYRLELPRASSTSAVSMPHFFAPCSFATRREAGGLAT
eukprot:scaffold6263_cov99-Isochrysis_galbana.AAC.3